MQSRLITIISSTIAVVLSLTLFGCAPNISPNNYNVATIGQAQKAQYGHIVQARTIQVSSNNEATGTLIGAGTGAVAGSAIGGDTRTNILAGIGGAIIGGITGNQIGKHTGNQMAIQYIVKLDNKNMVSVIQGGPQLYHIGQRVIVLMGGNAPARIISA